VCKASKEGECVNDKGKPVIRPYTPVTAPDTEGKLELLIKHYKGGAFTEHIFGLKAGDSVAMKGASSLSSLAPPRRVRLSGRSVKVRSSRGSFERTLTHALQARSPSTRGRCARRPSTLSPRAHARTDTLLVPQANEFESVGFIVGGSGVTPAWQILQAIECVPLSLPRCAPQQGRIGSLMISTSGTQRQPAGQDQGDAHLCQRHRGGHPPAQGV